MNFKGFILLGLLFAVVLISSTVGADQTSKDENKVVDGAAEKTKQESVDDKKYTGRGCGGCCYRYGYYGCGPRHCCAGTETDKSKESKAVDETSQTKPDGWGGHGGGGHGGGGHGGGGHGGGGYQKSETSQTKPDGWGGHGGGGHGGGGHGGGGHHGGGGGGWGGGGRGGGGGN